MTTRLITPREFAVRYGLHYVTVLRWIKEGRIDYNKVGRQRYVVDPGAMERITAAPNVVKDAYDMPFLRGTELAEILGISTRRVRQLVEAGHLPCRMISGRKRRYSVRDLKTIIVYRDMKSKLPFRSKKSLPSSAKEARNVLKRWAVEHAMKDISRKDETCE